MTPSKLPISVIIPAYNRAGMLPRAIHSAHMQRPAAPAEIIVVDDGSQDHTAEVGRTLNATVIRHTVNHGEGAARNSGMEASRFDWVAFLDSDDEWCESHLANLWPRREQHIALSDSAFSWPASGGGLLGHPSSTATVLRDAGELCFPANPIPMSGVIAQRQLLLALGGFRGWKTAADLDMWLRAIQHGTMLACPEVGYIYHVHDGQISSDLRLMQDGMLSLLENHRDMEWVTESLVTAVTSGFAWDRFRLALTEHRHRLAAKELWWLLRDPARWAAVTSLMWSRRQLRRRRPRQVAAHSSTSADVMASGAER